MCVFVWFVRFDKIIVDGGLVVELEFDCTVLIKVRGVGILGVGGEFVFLGVREY